MAMSNGTKMNLLDDLFSSKLTDSSHSSLKDEAYGGHGEKGIAELLDDLKGSQYNETLVFFIMNILADIRFCVNPNFIIGSYCSNLVCNFYNPNYSITNNTTKLYQIHNKRNSLSKKPSYLDIHEHHFDSVLVSVGTEEIVEEVIEGSYKKFRWNEIRGNITDEQKQAIAKLPFKMVKRCKAVMRQIICFSEEQGRLCDVLRAWVEIMKPTRADWLSVLKELKNMDHPLYLEEVEIVK